VTENVNATDGFEYTGYTLCIRPDGQSDWQPFSDTLAEWDDLVALAIQEAWGGKLVAYVEEETGKLWEFDSVRLAGALGELKALVGIIKGNGLDDYSIAYDGSAKNILVRCGPTNVTCSGDFAACKEYLEKLADKG